MREPEARKGKSLLQRWNALTAIPEAPPDADFAQREAVRKSRLTSSVLFFFTVMVVALLPACYFAPATRTSGWIWLWPLRLSSPWHSIVKDTRLQLVFWSILL